MQPIPVRVAEEKAEGKGKWVKKKRVLKEGLERVKLN